MTPPPLFVLQFGGIDRYLHADGKRLARHPIAARWFESREAADAVFRFEFSRLSSTVQVRQLTDDRQGVRP